MSARTKNKDFERRHSYQRRNINTLEKRERFLIVCEGKKTEPNYFRSFKVSTANIKVVGEGANTLSLVNVALELKLDAIGDKEPFDQVWVVMDRDKFPLQNYNGAGI